MKALAQQYKNEQFADFDSVMLLPDDNLKNSRIAKLHTNLRELKTQIDILANDTSYSQALRNELNIISIAIKLKINRLENMYKVEKSFFKPNTNAGFIVGPTAVATGPIAGTAVASAPTTPPTAVPTISLTGGRGKRRKTRQRKTRQSKTRKSRR